MAQQCAVGSAIENMLGPGELLEKRKKYTKRQYGVLKIKCDLPSLFSLGGYQGTEAGKMSRNLRDSKLLSGCASGSARITSGDCNKQEGSGFTKQKLGAFS